jgi:hypothetical protein
VFRRLSAFAIAMVAALSVLGVATPAHASYAGSFVSSINAARRSAGRPALAFRSDLAYVAARHSQRMASKDSLYHNPNLGGEVHNWQVVGENVGRGGDVASLHRAFMNSPAHRANILDRDYTEVGVGVVVKDGIMWVTEVFRRPYRAPVTRRSTPRKPATQRATHPGRRSTPTRPAARRTPKPVAKPKPVDRNAVLRARLAALTANPHAPANGTLPQALSYLEVMSALGR